MPLLNDYASDFVNVKLLNVSSDDDTLVLSRSPDSADFKVRLPTPFDRVVAIELDNYQVPMTALSQFTDANWIDFRLRNPAIFGGQWKQFSMALPLRPNIYNSPAYPQADLVTLLYQGFGEIILKDPDFGSKVDLVPLPDTFESTRILCRTLAFPPLATWPGFGSTEAEFLFASGPNANRSAALILGFDKIDTPFTPITINSTPFSIAASPRPAQINKFRYLDITIDEIPEFDPFYRVFVPTVRSVSSVLPENSARVRLLRQPVRRLETLTLRMRLPGGLKPFTVQPYYFSFRVYELKSNYKLPRTEESRLQLV